MGKRESIRSGGDRALIFLFIISLLKIIGLVGGVKGDEQETPPALMCSA